jgi:hypothetical protein
MSPHVALVAIIANIGRLPPRLRGIVASNAAAPPKGGLVMGDKTPKRPPKPKKPKTP